MLLRRTRKLASLTFGMHGVGMCLRVCKCEVPGPGIQPCYLRHGGYFSVAITIETVVYESVIHKSHNGVQLLFYNWRFYISRSVG